MPTQRLASSENEESLAARVRILLLPLTLYTGLVIPVVYFNRNVVITDAVSYIGIARLLSEGQFAESVSGYWSPLISWSITPLLLLDFDPLDAAHLALAIWGGVLVIAWHVFLKNSWASHRLVHTAALCLIAVSSVGWATFQMTPDIILAGTLTFYFAAVSSVRLCERYRIAFLSGCLGGLSYLAKSYALPFFFVHFTATVLLRVRLSPTSDSVRRGAGSWIVGLIGFLLVAGPWIAVLSSKYERVTFSTVAPIAHAIIGPNDMPRAHPVNELRGPADGRIDIWETPELLHYNHWSPLHSPRYFLHQLRFTVLSIVWTLNDIGHYDSLFFSVAGLVVGPLLVFRRRAARESFWIVWVPITVALYTGGFMLVYNTPRYLESILWPLICIYLLKLASCQSAIPRRRRILLTGLVAVSFFTTANARLYLLLREAELEDYNRFRVIAAQLTERNCEGCFAASHDRQAAMCIAFHANLPCCGVPAETEIAEIDVALRRHGVQTFLVQPGWALAGEFLSSTTWQQLGQFEYGQSTYRIYHPGSD